MPTSIPLKQEDLEDLIARTRMIEHVAEQREQLAQALQRHDMLLQQLSEGLTLYLRHQYDLGDIQTQWHLDLLSKQLVEGA
jgi:hypothetical protein